MFFGFALISGQKSGSFAITYLTTPPKGDIINVSTTSACWWIVAVEVVKPLLFYDIPNFSLRSCIPSTTAFTRCVSIASAHFCISAISVGDILKPTFSVRGLSVGLPIFFFSTVHHPFIPCLFVQ